MLVTRKGKQSRRQHGGIQRIDFSDADTNNYHDASPAATGVQPMWVDDAGNLWGCGNGIYGYLHAKYLYHITSANGESWGQTFTQKVGPSGYFSNELRTAVVIPGTSQQKILVTTASVVSSISQENGKLWYSTDGATTAGGWSEVYNPYLTSGSPLFIKGCANSWNVACTADGSRVYFGTYGYNGAATHRDVYYWDTATATIKVVFHIDAADGYACHIHGVWLDPEGGVWISVGENGGTYQGLWHSQSAPSAITVSVGTSDTGSFSKVYADGVVRPILGLQHEDASGNRYMYVTEDWKDNATITRIHYHDGTSFLSPYTTATACDFTDFSPDPLGVFRKLTASRWIGYGYESNVPYMVVTEDAGENWRLISLRSDAYKGIAGIGSMLAPIGTYLMTDRGLPMGSLGYWNGASTDYVPTVNLRPRRKHLSI